MRAAAWPGHGPYGAAPAGVLEAGDTGVVCYARVVITGAGGHRLHEELVVAGGRLRGGRFARIDTLRVGLDRLLAAGWTIHRAVKSEPWPNEASLEIAQVALRFGGWSGPVVLDGRPVRAITSALDPARRVSGGPERLAANAGRSFQGSTILGLGFTMSPEEARRLIDRDGRDAEVLFPYLNGTDLNDDRQQRPSRWVVNSFDWPIERAMTYGDCFEVVERLVKPGPTFATRPRRCSRRSPSPSPRRGPGGRPWPTPAGH